MPTITGNDDRDQRREDHLALRRARHDVDAAGRSRACSVPSMIPGFSRNWRRTSSTTAPPARPTASIESEANRQTIRPPISRPTSTSGSSSANSDGVAELGLQLDLERGEQHQRGERGRADRVALGDGLGGVADRVERVGDVAHLVRHVGHLGDAAGVVGDRAERVERDDHAAQRELRHHGHADAVRCRPARARRGCRRRSRARAAPWPAGRCAKPWMMFVAWPVSDAREVFLTGEKRVDV